MGAILLLLALSTPMRAEGPFLEAARGLSVPPSGLRIIPVTIYGKDDRKPLKFNGKPWTAIGRISGPEGHFCTGTVVGPDVLLTVAHCVMDGEGHPLEGLYFRAFQKFDGSLTESDIKACVGPAACRLGSRDHNREPGRSWALVRLRDAIGLKTEAFPVKALEPPALLEASIISIGYSEGARESLYPLAEHGCRIRLYGGPKGLLYDCDNWYGMSGGPLVTMEGGSPFIVGLHTRSGYTLAGPVPRAKSYSHEISNLGIDASSFAQALHALLADGWEKTR